METAEITSEEYLTRSPRAALTGIVRCVWRHRSNHAVSRVERIPPDGCPELICNLGAAYAERCADGSVRPQSPALFAGQLTRPLVLVGNGAVDTIGVRFEPWGARGFFGAPMTKVTDKRIALGAIRNFPAESLLAQLRTLDHEAQLGIVEGFVECSLMTPPDSVVAQAVRDLTDGKAVSSRLSPRQLQRRFADGVGVSMREFRSILRFRRVFDQIEQSANWVEAALAAGYFDQAQMARDFRRYLGCTASAWAHHKIGLATLIAEEASQTYKPPAAQGR